MFDSSVIDVAIGLVFVFLLLSLVASSAKEGLEAMFKRRAQDLERGIKELIGNDDKFLAALYDHGLINSLFAGKYGDKNAQLPSYIPSKNFALALMQLRNQTQGDAPALTLPSHVKQAFDAFAITAQNDADKLQQQIEDWYNSSMDRVSGWYKRRTQWWLLGIGLVITIAVNADSLSIAKRLSTDRTLREAVVTSAQAGLKNSPPPAPSSNPSVDQSIQKIKTNLTALDGIGLPLGWQKDIAQWRTEMSIARTETNQDNKSNLLKDAYWNLIFSHIAGWLLTALAISLGAPFWFDMLNKIMVIRSTVKPHEKSKEESSKDSDATTPTP